MTALRTAGAVLLLAAAMVAGHAVAPSSPPKLPRCEEDAVLIGAGAFQDGRWSAYVCGPAADDYAVAP